MTAPEDREWTDEEVSRLDSALNRYYPATAEDREIARTAPAWWTGADVSQTELPPLPMPELTTLEGDMASEDEAWIDYYTNDQMRDYARTALAAAQARANAAERDARRWRFLCDEAYEAVIPHGGRLNGSRTAWITKFHPGPSFEAAIDAAINAATEGVQHGEAK